MKNQPNISVNIPLITNGDASVVLNSLKKVNYPKNLLEIVIVEGQQIAKQRNIALKNSKGELVYLLDDDSRVQKNCFKIIAREFKNSKVAAVGGPSLTPKKDGEQFSDLIGYTLETYFGAMRMRFRYGNQYSTKGTEYRLIGANLALRKSAVLKVGLFNENIVPNEETELLRRLNKAGYKLKYKNNLSIYRSHRKNYSDLARQFFHYGRGRSKQILNSFEVGDLIFFIPVLFASYLFGFFIIRNLYYFIPIFLYIIFSLATSLKAAIKYRKPSLIYSMTITFPVIHLSYALGLIRGFLTQILSTPKNQDYKFKVKKFSLDKYISKRTPKN